MFSLHAKLDALSQWLSAILPGSAQRKKHQTEFQYWDQKANQEGQLKHAHFQHFFTSYFDLTAEDYRGKRVLDIGCGPRGSLEWATAAHERVGLDPLADKYATLGTGRHQMKYVCAPSEKIPFPDGHFDIVSSFNSLDHVDSIEKTLSEISRVVRSQGLFLLITEVGHPPTVCEPHSLTWDILGKFSQFEVLIERRIEKIPSQIYQSLIENRPYQELGGKTRPAILAAKLRRR